MTKRGRPKKQEEDILWAPPLKEYKEVSESKRLVRAKRERLLRGYTTIYEQSGNTIGTKERHMLDRLIAKHIPG